MWKIVEHTTYLLYDDGDYYDESFDSAKEARDEVRELEGEEEDYVDQCILFLDRECTKCQWNCE